MTKFVTIGAALAPQRPPRRKTSCNQLPLEVNHATMRSPAHDVMNCRQKRPAATKISVYREVIITEASLAPRKPPDRERSRGRLGWELNHATESSEDNRSDELCPEAATWHSARLDGNTPM